MFYLKAETTNDKGEKLIIGCVESACCRQDVYFIEDKPGHFIDAFDRIPTSYAMTQSILYARKMNLWKI